jgi:hypothetical protein
MASRKHRSQPWDFQNSVAIRNLLKYPSLALTFFLGGKFKEIQSNSEPSFHPSDIQICNLSSFSKDVSAPGLEKRLVLCYTKVSIIFIIYSKTSSENSARIEGKPPKKSKRNKVYDC